jgi:hypothetical protein
MRIALLVAIGALALFVQSMKLLLIVTGPVVL